MKTIYSKIVAFVVLIMMSATMVAQGQRVLLDEDFSTTTVGQIPTGWDRSITNIGTTSYLWGRYNENALYTQINCPAVAMFTGAYTSYDHPEDYYSALMTPEMTLRGNYTLTFDVKNVYDADISVYVSTDGGNTFWQNPLITNLSQLGMDWVSQSFSLAAYAQQKVRLVFVGRSMPTVTATSVAYAFLTNIKVQQPELCATPASFVINAIDSTTADLGWYFTSTGSIPDKYDVVVTNAGGDTIVNVSNYSSFSASYQLTGLVPGSDYTIKVRSHCESQYKGRSEWSEPFTFTTLCTGAGFPITENFNDMTVGARPDCWYYNVYNSAGIKVSSANYAGSFGNSVELVNSNGNISYIVSPRINHAANDLEFDFKLYGPKNASFYVGLMSNPADVATLEVLYIDSLSENNIWTSYKVNTAATSYGSMNGLYLAISFNGVNSTLYVDDVDIHQRPECARLEAMIVQSVDSSSVTLDWTEFEQYSSYSIMVVNGTDTSYRTSTTKPAVITGLADNTQYVFRVRGVCASGTAEWSAARAVRTTCRPQPIFNEDFESGQIPMCWQRVELNYSTSQHGNAWRLTENAYNSNYAIEYAGYEGNETMLVTAPISVSTAGMYDFSFMMYRAYIVYADLNVYINNRPDTIGGVYLATIEGSYRGAPEEEGTGWYKYDYNISLSGVVYIIFVGKSNASNTDNYALDDINVYMASTCRRVYDVTMLEPTPRTGGVEWSYDGPATQWIVDYTYTSDRGENESNQVVVNSTRLELALSVASNYHLTGRVATLCGVGDTSEWVSFDVTFATLCDIVDVTTVPYIEKFEDENYPYSPSCWQQIPVDAGGNATYYKGDQTWRRWAGGSAHLSYYAETIPPFDGYMLQHQQASNNAHTYLVTPQFNLPEGAELSFWMYRTQNGDNSRYLSVYLSDTPDTSGVALIRLGSKYTVILPEEAPGWYRYTVALPASGLKYIVFDGIESYAYCEGHIDNVRVGLPEECADITKFGVDSVVSDAARIYLGETGVAAWQASICTEGVDPDNGIIVNNSGVYAYATGLNATTEYSVYVRRACGADYSAWSAFSKGFKTGCAGFVVTETTPFVDDFESYAVNSPLDDCYSYVASNSTDQLLARESLAFVSYGYTYYSTPAHQGSRVIASGGQGSGTTAYTIFRPVALQAGVDYEASMWAACNDYYSRAELSASIGVYLYADENAKIADAVRPISAVFNTWTNVKGYFSVATSGTYYVGWHVEATKGTYQGVAIDELAVAVAGCVPPTNVVISNITSASAQMTIVSNTDSWAIKVCDHAFDPTTDNGNVLDQTSTSKNVNITGLVPNNEYYYAVRSYCGNVPSLEWSEVQSFRTECLAVSVPYTETFEDGSAQASVYCWAVNGIGSAMRNITKSHDGSASFEALNVSIVTPRINVSTLANSTLSGWAYSQTASAIAVGVMTDPSDISSYEILAEFNIAANRWTDFKLDLNILNDPDYAEWANAQYLAIVPSNDVTTYFDDIQIVNTPTCLMPSAYSIDNLTATSCQLNLTGSTAQSWKVVAYNGVYDDVTVESTSPSINITGLTPHTDYYLVITSICAQGDSTLPVYTEVFRTPCAAFDLPWTLDFEAVADISDECFSVSSDKGAAAPALSTSTFFAKGRKGLLFQSVYGDAGYLILPPFAKALNELKISFDYRFHNTDEGCGVLEIGLLTNKNDLTSFVSIAQVPAAGAFTSVEYDLSSIKAQYANANLCVRYSGAADANRNVAIDNVRVAEASECNQPAALVAKDLTINSARVEWEGAASEYEYELRQGTNVVATATTAQNYVDLTNLMTGAAYTFRVRANCSRTAVSAWTTVQFYTMSEPTPLPYSTGFETDADNSQWIVLDAGQSNHFCFGTDAAAVKSGTHALYVSSDDRTYGSADVESAIFAKRTFYLIPGLYNVAYDYRFVSDYQQSASLYFVPAAVELVAGEVNMTPVGAINIGTFNAYQAGWQEADVNVNIEEEGYYNLVIAWAYEDYGWTQGSKTDLAIDNLSIKALACGVITVVQASVTDVSAQLTVANGKENIQYAYRLGTTNDMNDAAAEVLSNNPIAISGLTANTTYYVWVSTACDADRKWTLCTFTTNHPSATMPYSTDFSNATENALWSFARGAASTSNHFVVGAAQGNTGNGLYVAYDNDAASQYYTEYYTDVYAYRSIYFEAGQYNIEYDYRATTRNASDFGRLLLVPSTIAIQGTTATASGALNPLYRRTAEGVILLDNNQSLTAASWTHNSVTFDVPVSGVYNLAAEWYNIFAQGINADYTAYIYYTIDNPFAIDNISISEVQCVLPRDVRATVVSADEALISFNAAGNVIVKYGTTNNVNAATNTIDATSNSVSLNGLDPLTTYYAFVAADCGEDQTSNWVPVSFTTYCTQVITPTVANPYDENFESYAHQEVLTNCWVGLGGESYFGQGQLQAYSATGSAHSGSMAVLVDAYYTWAASARPFNLTAGTTYEISVWGMSGAANTDIVGVGYIENGEFVTLASTKLAQNIYTKVRAEFTPQTSGVYMLGIYGEMNNYYNVFVDDMHVGVCQAPSPSDLNVTLNGLTANLSWTGSADSYNITLTVGGNSVYTTTTTNTAATIPGLSSATDYEVSVVGVYGTDESTPAVAQFSTECGVVGLPFAVNFANATTIPACWVNQVDGSGNWRYNAGTTSWRANGAYTNVERTNRLISPEINVDAANYMLKVEYRATSTQVSLDVFNIGISFDGGQTIDTYLLSTQKNTDDYVQFRADLAAYAGKNICVVFEALGANQGTPSYSYRYFDLRSFSITCFEELPDLTASLCRGDVYEANGFSINTIDMDPGVYTYEKYVESTTAGVCDSRTTLTLSLNESHIIFFTDTICEGDVYSKHGFTGLTAAGQYVNYLTASTGCDSTLVLELLISNDYIEKNAHICEGDALQVGDTIITTAGIYTFTATNKRGCDSVTVLNVYVDPRYYNTDIRACEGQIYTWGDTVLTTTGVYSRRFTNVNGCDSIETITFTVIPTHVSVTRAICPGEEFVFGDTTITTAGTYTRRLVNSLGCDSIVTLTVELQSEIRSEFSDYACEGYPYNAYGFSIPSISADTVITRTTNSVNGCDSVIVVNITFIPTVHEEIDVYIKLGESYNFGGSDYSTSGTYTRTFESSLGCDSVVTLNLHVGEGVEAAYTLPVVIAPNPIRSGTFTYVMHDWTDDEREGMKVFVISSTGQLVNMFEPTEYPIQVSGIHTTGVYYVRIVAGNGKVYVGKLVVK